MKSKNLYLKIQKQFNAFSDRIALISKNHVLASHSSNFTTLIISIAIITKSFKNQSFMNNFINTKSEILKISHGFNENKQESSFSYV